ncbi:MAG: PDZ domain-containing protein, partial [Phycisphaerales bacterium]
MPNQALILLLAVLITSQPAPSPSAPTASTSSVPQTQAQAPPTTPRNPRSRAPRPGSPRRIGIRLDQGPAGEWRISAVVPFSPAHRAGLQANNLILKVRERVTRHFSQTG